MNSEDQYLANTYSKRPVEVVRGSGALVYDSSGKEYIDCMSGIGVALLGHSNPIVIKAVNEQAGKLMTCHGLLYNDARAKFAEKLASITPPNLDVFFLSNSGAESVECAIKLARKYTGKTGIIAMKRSFHGKTLGSLSATWNPKYRKGFEPLVSGIDFVSFGNIEELRNTVNENTAAVILEPIQGESGIILPPGNYLKEVRELCTERNILMILDEVQTFGRTGNFFAAETYGVIPDIICIAKGIGGGLPLGVTASTSEIFSCFGPGDHTSTLGGNPLSCAAGLATINELENGNWIKKGAEMGEKLLEGLRRLKNEAIREARGVGAMSALELRFPAQKALENCLENGLLVMASGRNVMRFLPPLVITEEQVNRVIEIVKNSLGKVR